MPIGPIPYMPNPPSAGWHFHGAWTEADKVLITQTLTERVAHRSQAKADPWLLVAHNSRYYAHCPNVHELGYGYAEDDAAELADTLWGHYFTLRLGPLVLSSTPITAPSPAENIVHGPPQHHESFAREMEALEHFHYALAHIAQGEYAAAKQAMQLSFELYPADSFYSYRRVETSGDIESYLGNDQAAAQHYERALQLATTPYDRWVDTELRLKLVWCALRLQRVEQARRVVDGAIAACERGRAQDGGSRALNYLHGLAFATRADVALHTQDIDAALIAANQARTIAQRLGQSYGEKARLYAYLAWQLYLHGETSEARSLAHQAWTAMERWVPLESAQTQAIRASLTTILGRRPQPARLVQQAELPPFSTMVAVALAAARAMQNGPEQVLALHTLAPYLERAQFKRPFDDIIVWSDEDRRFFAPYRILLTADLARAISRTEAISSRVVRALIGLDPKQFAMLHHEWLYADTLIRLRGQVAGLPKAQLADRINSCAASWVEQVATAYDDHAHGPIEGLAMLLPHLQPPQQYQAISLIEGRLLTQLRGHRYTPSLFLATLPVLARLQAGDAVVEAIAKSELHSMEVWIACLGHAVADDQAEDMRASIVRATLDTLKQNAPYGSTTDVAEVLCHLAPYLRGSEVHEALSLATSVRSIVPRVRALTALAALVSADEREVLLLTAWQSATRSKKADTVGAALVEVVRVAGDFRKTND